MKAIDDYRLHPRKVTHEITWFGNANDLKKLNEKTKLNLKKLVLYAHKFTVKLTHCGKVGTYNDTLYTQHSK